MKLIALTWAFIFSLGCVVLLMACIWTAGTETSRFTTSDKLGTTSFVLLLLACVSVFIYTILRDE